MSPDAEGRGEWIKAGDVREMLTILRDCQDHNLELELKLRDKEVGLHSKVSALADKYQSFLDANISGNSEVYASFLDELYELLIVGE